MSDFANSTRDVWTIGLSDRNSNQQIIAVGSRSKPILSNQFARLKLIATSSRSIGAPQVRWLRHFERPAVDLWKARSHHNSG